jgi:uronate dehydrogenase
MGRVIRPALAQVAETVRLTGRRESPEGLLAAHEEYVGADLADPAAAGRAVAGVEAIVHLAGIPDEAPFDDLIEANVRATGNLYEAARQAGARRVIFASSNHAIGFYPVTQRIGPLDPPRPDTLYGVTKVFGEALARLYYDKWGIESVCLRIGSFRERPENRRQLSTWLSHRDGVALVLSALTATEVGYRVVFGASANSRSWWSDDSGEPPLAYQPLDDAESHVDELASDGDAGAYQGGPFVAPDYRGGLG